ncbi:hypothetical protein FC40_GL000256 [Ligilactobacillus hayakitensis DSM 18933 = JCM 14209]|uniref:Uncharacterized protein n=1 Tax=Ligilactobacillus hayakitensis DSM 18933 = JCM 14209 TaxID=1423755 RepID=A0A0R1WNV4_9LACO|nr:hypothetical protein [Ligilactobacillus hayakitensis]KRM19329.1 hypothetical protein FC40_GL000256 [Ligilactobacillus hayakitensis DSM 18933 = JCM 14209]
MAESEAQKRASRRWNAKNREHRSYLTSRSSARSFIRNKATLADLDELQGLIDTKRQQLLDEAAMEE